MHKTRVVDVVYKESMMIQSAAYEKELQKAREIAFEELTQQAIDRGANAVVGIDIDYETVGTGSMLMVTVSGTAVSVR